jgi:hypothetical protein
VSRSWRLSHLSKAGLDAPTAKRSRPREQSLLCGARRLANRPICSTRPFCAAHGRKSPTESYPHRKSSNSLRFIDSGPRKLLIQKSRPPSPTDPAQPAKPLRVRMSCDYARVLQTAKRCQRILERTLECAACSRSLQPSRSPDAWSPQGRARIRRRLLPGLKLSPLPTRIHRLLLPRLSSSRRRRAKPWSGSRDAGTGTVAGMSGSAATTSSGFRAALGMRDFGRGTAIAGDGLAATGSSKADQAGAPGERCAPA